MRRGKYNVAAKEDRTCDGIVFDSVTEMEHYMNLVLLQKRGEISKLQLQPKFEFVVNGVKLGRFKPDFAYLDKENKPVIEDVKGWKVSKRTGKLLPRVDREFGLKVRLMRACFGLDVRIV